jgi:RimJ/RimL family protein N-acetyltransferase
MITEEEFLDFNCPYCDGAVSFPRSSAGTVEECFNCLEDFIVPEPGSAVGKKLPLPITTSRLRLRRFTENDAVALTKLVSDERFVVGGVDGLADTDEEKVFHWLQGESRVKLERVVKLLEPSQMFRLAIEQQDGNKLIGYGGFRMTAPRQAALEISVHPGFQRQGFASEAVAGLLGFCFAGIRLHRVIALCDSGNAGACRLSEKAGLRREGLFVKDRLRADGAWVSTAYYAVLEEECAGTAGVRA